MEKESVELLIPFESLLDCVEKLSLKEKIRLWELLDEQLSQIGEEILEKDPSVQAEIQEARTAYEKGDYITIDEYIAQQQNRKK